MNDGFGDPAFGTGFGSAVGGRGRGLGGGILEDGSAAAAREYIFGSISEEQCQRLARAFEQSRGPDGFVLAEEGRRQLQRTGLPNEMLQNIWHLSDLDRDGRLSLREFVCAMHLADAKRQGQPLPVEVKLEEQVALVRKVERLVSHTTIGFASIPEATKPSRHDDFSTVDTTASDIHLGRQQGRWKHKNRDGSDGFSSALEFDTAGARAESELDLSAFGSRGMGIDGLGALGSQRRAAPIPEDFDAGAARRLGELASVFEVVARLDPAGELRRLCGEVLNERRELEQQLARRRDFEKQLREMRIELDGLHTDRRKVELETVSTQRRISHLQDELAFVDNEVQGAEEDLQMLRDAGGPDLQDSRRGPAPYSSPEDERRDVLSKVRAEREMLQKDQRSIEDIRMKFDDIFKEKLDTQMQQQALLEKQRQTEQDRGLMLTAIEAERGKLSAMCAERLRLWEERSALERELTQTAEEQWLVVGNPAATRAAAVSSATRGVPFAKDFHSAPAESQQQQRQRGIRQEEQPSVIYGSVPTTLDQELSSAFTSGFGASYGAQGAETPSPPLPRADHRGVRN